MGARGNTHKNILAGLVRLNETISLAGIEPDEQAKMQAELVAARERQVAAAAVK